MDVESANGPWTRWNWNSRLAKIAWRVLKINPVEMGPMEASFLRTHLRTLPVQARSSLPPSMRSKVVALIVESEYC